jgi:hypothetical protein
MKFGQPFEQLDYGVLNEELGTRPRTTYLKKIIAAEATASPGTERGSG